MVLGGIVYLWMQSDEHFDPVSLLFPTRLKIHVVTATPAFHAPIVAALLPSVIELELFDRTGRTGLTLYSWVSECSEATSKLSNKSASLPFRFDVIFKTLLAMSA